MYGDTLEFNLVMLVQPVYSARLYLLPYQMINFGSDGLEVFWFKSELVHPSMVQMSSVASSNDKF